MPAGAMVKGTLRGTARSGKRVAKTGARASKTIFRIVPWPVKLAIIGILLIVVLVVYLIVDTEISRDYSISDSQGEMSMSYKYGFEKLVKTIENGGMTGIPTYDDSGVMYGKRVDITVGSGDFVRFNEVTDTKTISNEGINNQKWHPTWSGAFPMFYSTKFLNSCVLYDQSGVVKLFDRYILTATGEYWPHILGSPVYSGTTIRVILEDSRYFDIICTDSKSNGDPLSLNTPDGKWSMGHKTLNPSGSTYSGCICEFTTIKFDSSIYPINISTSPYRPTMDYEKSFGEIRLDPLYAGITNSFQKIHEFKGNIVAMQLIVDPRVEEILRIAEAEVKPYQDKFIADGSPRS